MSTKLWIGTIMFFIIATICCNVVDGNNMITSTSDLAGLQSSSVTSSQDTSGTPATYFSMGANFFSSLWKMVTFDYTVFRNTDGTPNDWVVIRYLLIAVGIAIIIETALVFRQILSG